MIASLLPADDPDCAAVLAAHQRCWPHLLAGSMDAGPAHIPPPTDIPCPAAG